jgi:hypothetical protein
MGKRNQRLIEYGIQTEESDYRLHIAFAHARAYFFPTGSGKRAIAQGLGKPFMASQPGVSFTTGVGRKVQWQEIEDCIEIQFPPTWLADVRCKRTDSTSEKGRKAIIIAKKIILNGMLSIPLQSREITEKQIQVKGKDLIVTGQASIEVKCDYFAAKNGICLQTAECNPLGRY